MAGFGKILIANRGEIACRVLRTAQTLGYATAAVYSEADADARHVRLADEAVPIGPAPAAESYLNIDRILEAARLTGADAVHPGYGFLSENAEFAKACVKAGLAFIGPPAAAIAAMGDKAEARRRMEKAGVRCVPGHQGSDQSDAALTGAAETLGFPLMVKAAAGGGGKGLRRVEGREALAQALARARSEARNAFGSDALILEKVIAPARHVEIQVCADAHGNAVHMGERDCSVQRRHQKVIEEAPGPGISEDLRTRMGKAAVAAALAVGYQGAGTVEFLLDADGRFYFLEMNTRLQVEHPVTEMVAGIDLVAWQIAIAEGRTLPRGQEDVDLNGHAIEARLYAEDAYAGFLPRPGRVDHVVLPALEDVRMDHGLDDGQDVPPFYDPLVAKVIAWGVTRETARRRLIRALKATHTHGLEINRVFLIDVLDHSEFTAGKVTTDFLDTVFVPQMGGRPEPGPEDYALGALVLYLGAPNTVPAAWQGLKGWSSSGRAAFDCLFASGEKNIPLRLIKTGDTFHVEQGGAQIELRVIEQTPEEIVYLFDGVRRRAAYFLHGHDRVTVARDGGGFTLENRLLDLSATAGGAADGVVLAPMHGRVQTVHVQTGGAVQEGKPLLVLEAMKMEHDITSPITGTVADVLVTDGEQVAAGARLVIVNAEEE